MAYNSRFFSLKENCLISKQNEWSINSYGVLGIADVNPRKNISFHLRKYIAMLPSDWSNSWGVLGFAKSKSPKHYVLS